MDPRRSMFTMGIREIWAFWTGVAVLLVSYLAGKLGWDVELESLLEMVVFGVMATAWRAAGSPGPETPDS